MTEEYDLDKNVGKLGFGMMRLPRKGDGIDIEETKKLVDAFMISRFNYFDTAFAYPGSEEAIKEALVNRYPSILHPSVPFGAVAKKRKTQRRSWIYPLNAPVQDILTFISCMH